MAVGFRFRRASIVVCDVTGSPGIKDDLVNAGAFFENASVVVDRNSVSSRKPDDLPDFCRELIRLMVQRSGSRA